MNNKAPTQDYSKIISNSWDVSDFIQGQEDCRKGMAHESGKSEAYDAGYNYEYWCEQRKTEMSSHDARITAET